MVNLKTRVKTLGVKQEGLHQQVKPGEFMYGDGCDVAESCEYGCPFKDCYAQTKGGGFRVPERIKDNPKYLRTEDNA